MAQKNDRTETFITVMAWLAIVGGALMGVFAVLGVLIQQIPAMKEQQAAMAALNPQWGEQMQRQMKVQWLFAGLHAPLYIAAIVTGLGMLRRRLWSRAWMQGILAGMIVLGMIGMAYTLSTMDFAKMMPTQTVKGGPDMSAIAGVMGPVIKAFSILFGLFWWSLQGLCIWFLRRKETRACFKGA